MTDQICPYGEHCKARDRCNHSGGHTRQGGCEFVCAPTGSDEPRVSCVPVEPESEVERWPTQQT